MNNIALELIFWVSLSLYILTRMGVFKKGKSRKKGYSRKNK